MKKLATLSLCFALSIFLVNGQGALQKHNPKVDLNLSPSHNEKINPTSNTTISPKYNWNLNPYRIDALNPSKNYLINPLISTYLNPSVCESLNPMFTNSLQPKSTLWSGNFLFDKDDKLIGFVSVANQNVMLSFNSLGDWTGYYVRSSLTTYNEFGLDGKWTGNFLCPDSMIGYNIFNSAGDWTGQHIK